MSNRRKKNKFRVVRDYIIISLAMIAGSLGWCAFLLAPSHHHRWRSRYRLRRSVGPRHTRPVHLFRPELPASFSRPCCPWLEFLHQDHLGRHRFHPQHIVLSGRVRWQCHLCRPAILSLCHGRSAHGWRHGSSPAAWSKLRRFRRHCRHGA